jgi:hypothetical protein
MARNADGGNAAFKGRIYLGKAFFKGFVVPFGLLLARSVILGDYVYRGRRLRRRLLFFVIVYDYFAAFGSKIDSAYGFHKGTSYKYFTP